MGSSFAFADPVYHVSDLGPGVAWDLNNSGVVVLSDNQRIFRVTDGVRAEVQVAVDNIGQPVFATSYDAAALNDAGTVVGIARWAFSVYAFSDRLGDARVVRAGGALGLNSTDFAVGWADAGQTPAGPMQLAATFEFWNGLPSMQVPAPQNYGEFRAVNASGVAVGTMAETKTVGSIPEPYRYSAYRARAVKWQAGQITYLDNRSPGDLPVYRNGDPAVRLSEANSVNDAGVVVGAMAVSADGPKHAFRHAGAGLEDLGVLPGNVTSTANDINGSGQIVGESANASGNSVAVVWEAGVAVDLNQRIPTVPGLTLARARAVNDGGQIVGEALIGGVPHAFLLTPLNAGIPPRILEQPTGLRVGLGESFTLHVRATGSLPFRYTWKRGDEVLAGQETDTLTLPNATANLSGTYRVVVANDFGQAISQPAEVVVLDPRLTAMSFAGLQIEGAVGARYRIEASPRLGPETWTPLETLSVTNALQLWVDWDSVHHPARLYRAVRLPAAASAASGLHE